MEEQYRYSESRVKNDARHHLAEEARVFNETLRQKILDEKQIGELGKKKTPVALFNHLTSLVEKYFNFIPQQSAVYALLTVLREHDLLRYLLSISIFLGNMETPETMIAEFKRIYQESHPTANIPIDEAGLDAEGLLSKKERRKLKALKAREVAQPQQAATDDQNVSCPSCRHNDHKMYAGLLECHNL